jgi:hypothetical protein
MNKDYLVYEHIRIDTGQVFYIGKGKPRRVRQTSNRNPHWHRIVKKSGGYNARIAACGLSENDALNLEVSMIAAYRTANIKLCNMTNGGDGISGYKWQPEAIEKLKLKLKGRMPHNKGLKASDATREKQRAAKLGKKQSRNHVEKCRAANVGRKFTAETCAKISAALTGKKLSDDRIKKMRMPIYCTTNDTVYPSVRIAAAALGVWDSNISKCAKGKLSQTGGFHFTYALQSLST